MPRNPARNVVIGGKNTVLPPLMGRPSCAASTKDGAMRESRISAISSKLAYMAIRCTIPAARFASRGFAGDKRISTWCTAI